MKILEKVVCLGGTISQSIQRIVASAFFVGLVCSFRLWTTTREYPVVPLFSDFQLPQILSIIVVISTLIFLIGIIIRPDCKIFSLVVLILVSVMIIFDVTRIQPWVIMYLLLFIIALVYDRESTYKQAPWLFTAAIASIYFFSGLQKINHYFFKSTIPWVFHITANPSNHLIILLLGISVIALELLLSILLFLPQQRRKAFWLSVIIATGAVVIVCFSHNFFNPIIIPWNFALVAIVETLTRNELPRLTVSEITKNKFSTFFFIIVFLLPFLSFANLYPAYLSQAVYSGNNTYTGLMFSEKVATRLPLSLQETLVFDGKFYSTTLTKWALEDINVPAYPELRSSKIIFKNLCSYSRGEEGDVVALIAPRRTWLHNKNLLTLTCP